MINNQNNQNNQNFQNYYQQHSQMPQQPMEVHNINPNTLNNILFVADLHEDITEEDLSLFFKDYKFKHAKLYRY